uniref:Uncharacterized protein n=1 Tax=Ditylenchus dipsaci TaxID=166011 RepID=A0A915DZD2_9BILA
MSGKSPAVKNAKDSGVDKTNDADSDVEKTGTAAQDLANKSKEIAAIAAGECHRSPFKKSLKYLEDNGLMEAMTKILVDYLVSQAPVLLLKNSFYKEARYLSELEKAAMKTVAEKGKTISFDVAGKAVKGMAGDSVDTTKATEDDLETEDEAVQALLSLSHNFSAAAGKIVDAARVVPDCSKSATAMSDEVAKGGGEKAEDVGGRAGDHFYTLKVNVTKVFFKKSLRVLKEKELMGVMTTILVDHLISQAPILLLENSFYNEAKYLSELKKAARKTVADESKEITYDDAGKFGFFSLLVISTGLIYLAV